MKVITSIIDEIVDELDLEDIDWEFTPEQIKELKDGKVISIDYNDYGDMRITMVKD